MHRAERQRALGLNPSVWPRKTRYEEFIKNSNDAISAAQKEITAKSDSKSETESTKVPAARPLVGSPKQPCWSIRIGVQEEEAHKTAPLTNSQTILNTTSKRCDAMRCPQRRPQWGLRKFRHPRGRPATDPVQVQAEGDRQTALGDGEALAQYKAELHGSCDFLLKPAGTPATGRGGAGTGWRQ